MVKISSYVPVISKTNPNKFCEFMDGYFYFGKTRFIITENKGKGVLVLKKTQLPSVACQTALKVILLFTGVIPLFAALWALGRYLHLQVAPRKWSFSTEMPKLNYINGQLQPTQWPNTPVENHAGIYNPGTLCWLISEFQVIAHIESLRNLFAPDLNPLVKRDQESEEQFQLRQEIQLRGKGLIEAILSGNQGESLPDLSEFAFLLQRAGLIHPNQENELFKYNELQNVPTSIQALLKNEIPQVPVSISMMYDYTKEYTDCTITDEEFIRLANQTPLIPADGIIMTTSTLGNKFVISLEEDKTPLEEMQLSRSTSTTYLKMLLGKREDGSHFARYLDGLETREIRDLSHMPDMFVYECHIMSGHKNTYMPNEVTPIEGGPTYTLQASSGYTGSSHFTAFVREEKGQIIHFNDTRVQKMKSLQMRLKNYSCYYYVKKNL